MLVVGAAIVAFITTPLGTAVMYVSSQLATPAGDVHALPPPSSGHSHGAAGSGLNGFGGSIAPSATSQSWPGTGAGTNGGPFAFVGAHHGPLWGVPAGDNNSGGVGYCVMEDEAGSGTVTLHDDPAVWDASEMARAGALMSTFGGDRVVPYGVDDSGMYDVATGEWELPQLLGGGEYTRRRQVAVNFGVRMFLEDLSVHALPGGRKLARDTSVVNGSGGEFAALRNGYQIAQYMADAADIQSAIGGITLMLDWKTPDGLAPTTPGTYPLEVIVADSTGRRVGMVPVLQLSDVGIGTNRSAGAVARVDNTYDSSDDMARWNAAAATGWPVWNMAGLLMTDTRFAVGPGTANPAAADVADRSGVARFDVTITSTEWELAFHAQAPTSDVSLYAGTGIQGQVTWAGAPQSASVHAAYVPPSLGRFRIRKVLDDAGVQGGRDMSGFAFEVGTLGTFTTDASGITPVIEGLTGDLPVTEVGRPTWAAGLIDTGPITFRIEGGPDPGAQPVVEFVYTNRVPPASITTRASDRADGDRFVSMGGAVDDIDYCGLVPGTEYRALGTIQVVVAGSPTPSGVEGSTTFVPAEPCGRTSVNFDVTADSALRGAVGVVFQTVVVGATGQIVAEHVDPSNAAQTLYFPEVETVMRADTGLAADVTSIIENPGDSRQTVEVGTAVIDVVTHRGLAPGLDYRADLTLHERLDDGTCVVTGMTASTEFSVAPDLSEVRVGPVTIDRPGVFVGFERIYVIDRTNPEEAAETLVAAHEDCDEITQTVRAVEPPPPPPPPPIPSTTAPTTTTPLSPPAAEGTTTTSPPVVEPTTTSTMPEALPTTTVASPPIGTLPRTGSSARSIALLAAFVASCGVGTLAVTRRR